MLEAYDKSFQKTAVLHLAFNRNVDEKLNGVGELRFSLPMNDLKAQFVQPYTFVKDDDGVFYRVIGDGAKKQVTQDQIDYTCEHAIATLVDDVMFQAHVVGNIGMYTAACINYVLGYQTTKRWQLGTCDFTRQFEYGWESENLLNALWSIPNRMTDKYMWAYDFSTTPWKVSLKKIDETRNPQFYIRAGMNLITSSTDRTGVDMCTRLYMLGYGEGDNQLTIKSVNNGVPYLQSPKAITDKYGIISKVLVDRRYEYADSLMEYGQSILAEIQNPKVSKEFTLTDLYEITKDDLKTAHVGDICYMEMDDTRAYVTGVRRNLDIAGDMSIEMSTKTGDVAGTIADLADRQRIEQVYAQGATQIYGQSLQENATSTVPCEMNFTLPSEMRIINTVKARISLSGFRTYSQATKGGGGTTRTSSEGGATTSTSSSGGGATYSSSNGGATTSTSSSGGGLTTATAGGGATNYTSSSGGGSTYTSSSGGNSTQTSSSGGESTSTSSSGGGGQSTSSSGGGTYSTTGSAGAAQLTSAAGGSVTKTLVLESRIETDYESNREGMEAVPVAGGNVTYGGNTDSGGLHYHTTSHYHTTQSHHHTTTHIHGSPTHSHTVSGSSTNAVNVTVNQAAAASDYATVTVNTSDGATSQTGAHTHPIGYHSHGAHFHHWQHRHGMGHSHTITIEAHTHTVNVPAHTHSITVSDHSHTVNIPAHTHSVSIPSHTHSVTIPAHTHTVQIPNHTHTVTTYDHTHSVTLPNHTHTVTIYDHTHTVTIPNHTHTVQIPNHTHTLTLPDHTHDVIHGIFRTGSPKGATIQINGVNRGTMGTNGDIDLTPYLATGADGKIPRGSWIKLGILPDDLAYVTIDLFVQGFVQSRGGGSY